MARPRQDRKLQGAIRRLLSLLLAGLFATGFLPAAGPGCDCTAERNCGCTCWIGRESPRAEDSAAEPQGSCCARGTRGASTEATSCAARTPPGDGSPAPGSESAPSHDRRPLDWELTGGPVPFVQDAARDLVPAPALAPRSAPFEPPTPPPRPAPFA